MALPNFTLGVFSSGAAQRSRAHWGVLLGVAILALPSLARAQVAIPFSTNVQFLNTSQVASFVVNLDTLPARPELLVDAVPTSGDPNIELQIEITEVQIDSNAQDESCPSPTSSPIRSAPGAGPAQLVWKVWVCDPEISVDTDIGETARVNVRVASFGGAGAPANVQIAMRGVTSPAIGTQLMPYWAPGVQHTITLRPSKDGTIYERQPTTSDGAGQFLWAGRDVAGTPFAIRSLLAFPVRGGPIPTNATIDSVTLRLDVESIVGTGNQIQVWSAGFNPPWDEGIADAAGDEFQGTTSATSSASWTFQTTGPDYQWGGGFSAPGGDPFDLLVSQAVTTTGVKTLSSTALKNYVAAMLTNTGTLVTRDGLILRGPESSASSSGVQLASRENGAAGAIPPELVVTFTLPAAPQEAQPRTGIVYFVDEGQNLRWIYDLDQDNVYVTPVNGVCTVIPDPFNNNYYFAPYSYVFNGAPGYTGHDCCTWHVDSPQSGTVGTGQLIFFHNLDTTNPANLPPDTDRDGIRDLCDNCPSKANGPLLGSCLTGPSAGAPCRSNPECTSGVCSLSQEDDNSDKIGNACVPEPGLGALLAAGLLGLCGLGSRKNARRGD